MNEVKIQDLETKYVSVIITSFRVKSALSYRQVFLLRRAWEKHYTYIKRTNWFRRQ